jgi:hypothetical protein
MEHVSHTEKMGNIYRILVGKPQGKGRVGELGIDGRIIL